MDPEERLMRLRGAVDNVVALAEALCADGAFASDLHERLGDNADTRRVYVRSMFAFVDGVVNAFKRYAVTIHDIGPPLFTPAEVLALRDVVCDLSDKGEVMEQPRFFRFAANVRFAVRAFAVASGHPKEPDYSLAGWAALLRAVRVRNRLMHPRNAADLDVSESELADVTAGVRWFQHETGKVLTAGRSRG